MRCRHALCSNHQHGEKGLVQCFGRLLCKAVATAGCARPCVSLHTAAQLAPCPTSHQAHPKGSPEPVPAGAWRCWLPPQLAPLAQAGSWEGLTARIPTAPERSTSPDLTWLGPCSSAPRKRQSAAPAQAPAPGHMPAGARASEVDRKLHVLVSRQGRLLEPYKDSIVRVLRLFNLCDFSSNFGPPKALQVCPATA